MKKLISFLLSFAMVLSFGTIVSYADDIYDYTIIDLSQQDMELNAYTAIENALKLARDNATAQNPYLIHVPSGTYNLTAGLHIYSNTYLHLEDDTTLVRAFESGNMLKSGVQTDIFYGYDGYSNIVIEGGVWDSKNIGSSCGFRFGHCSNIKMNNVTICNVRNSHHLEFAAVDGFTITNCTFSGYVRTKNVTGEAIQIDIIHGEDHFPSYSAFDDTPCKNITVSDSRFIDVFAGVGTRSGVAGIYFDNIKITDNVFENIGDKAISCFNYRNCVIKNNVIKNATAGIFYEYFPAKNLNTKLYMPNNKEQKISIDTNCKTKITDNDITVIKNSGYNTPCGISVYGGVLTKAQATKNKLFAGNYFVNDILIKKNKIKINTNTGVGIYLSYVKNSKITDNTILDKVSAKTGSNGISDANGANNTYTKNTISGKFNNSISNFNKTVNNTFSANKITGSKSNGIYIEKGSKAVVNANNSISKKINSNGKKAAVYTSKAALKSVSLSKNKPVIKWKKVPKSSGYKLYRSTEKNGSYKLIKTVSGASATSYRDSTAKKGVKYYYKVAPYKSLSGSALIGKCSAVKAIKSK